MFDKWRASTLADFPTCSGLWWQSIQRLRRYRQLRERCNRDCRCWLGTDGIGYCLENLTVLAGPKTWANIAITRYDRWAQI